MLHRSRYVAFALLAVGTILVGRAAAENEGLPDLDQAVEVKLTAQSLPELTQVIELCQSALEKGLDEENTEFAERLLSSTLIQRGTAIAGVLLGERSLDPRLAEQGPQLRQMAQNDLEAALEIDAEQPQAHYVLGRLYLLRPSDRERAKASLDKAIEKSGEDTLLKAKSLAARAAAHEDAEQRLADYNAAVELAPRDDETLRARALFHIEQGKLDEAVADLSQAVELNPEDASTHEALGLALATQGKYDEALESLERAIELAPDAPMAYIHRSRIHILKSQPQEAIEDLDQVLSNHAANPAMLLLRASAYEQMRDFERALLDVEQVLRMQPGLLEARRMRAILLAQSGKLDESIAELEAIKDESPQDAELLLQLATLLRMKKEPQKALEYYSAAVELEPDNIVMRQNRADTYLWLGKQAEALADYEAAVKLDPDNSNVLNNLAWLLATSPDENLRDGKRAVELATRAAEVTEHKQAHILSTLAASYAETGDFENAVKWSEKALEIGPEEMKDNLRKELEAFRAGRPWRELQIEGVNQLDEEGRPIEPADDTNE